MAGDGVKQLLVFLAGRLVPISEAQHPAEFSRSTGYTDESAFRPSQGGGKFRTEQLGRAGQHDVFSALPQQLSKRLAEAAQQGAVIANHSRRTLEGDGFKETVLRNRKSHAGCAGDVSGARGETPGEVR